MLYDENRNWDGKYNFVNKTIDLGMSKTFLFSGDSFEIPKEKAKFDKDLVCFEVLNVVSDKKSYLTLKKDQDAYKKLKKRLDQGQMTSTITRKGNEKMNYFYIEEDALDGEIFIGKIADIPPIKRCDEEEVKKLFNGIIQNLTKAEDNQYIGFRHEKNQNYSNALKEMIKKKNDIIKGYKINAILRENVLCCLKAKI